MDMEEVMPQETIQPTGTVGPPLKQLRTAQGLSLRQLAERAGVTASYLSAVERGKISPTIALLGRVLAALGTDLAGFFTAEQEAHDCFVFRREAMRTVDDGGRRYTFVFPKRSDVPLEVQEETLFPGETPEYEELEMDLAGLILSGTMLLDIAGRETQVVGPGDAFYLPAGHPTRGRCEGEAPVHLITIMTPPRD
jgi:transcriptional regulator with XRE-family HTH domain